MTVSKNVSLHPYNTFSIDARCDRFSIFSNVDELHELVEQEGQPALILGGGSNVLLTRDIDGLVLKNEISGIDVIDEDDQYVFVRSGGGVNWHAFVMYCVEKGLGGVENLSLIPGSVGASPMQNIGAYGVEIKDVFHELNAWHINERTTRTFSVTDCAFGYRESVFKNRNRGEYVITDVVFRLRKQPVYNTSYGAIREELEKMGVMELSVKAISDAVINIRRSKLPDPKEVGNAGSFFKNPVIEEEKFTALKEKYPTIVAFPAGNAHVKLAAGWMIEQCGWKGYREGDAGCYPKQALVLVNYGHARGEEVYTLSEKIIASVEEKFGVRLEREVNIV